MPCPRQRQGLLYWPLLCTVHARHALCYGPPSTLPQVPDTASAPQPGLAKSENFPAAYHELPLNSLPGHTVAFQLSVYRMSYIALHCHLEASALPPGAS